MRRLSRSFLLVGAGLLLALAPIDKVSAQACNDCLIFEGDLAECFPAAVIGWVECFETGGPRCQVAGTCIYSQAAADGTLDLPGALAERLQRRLKENPEVGASTSTERSLLRRPCDGVVVARFYSGKGSERLRSQSSSLRI